MAERTKITLGSTNTIVLKQLRDNDTGLLITGATVTAQIFDAGTTNLVAGAPNPITFTGSGTVTGKYTGTIPSGIAALVDGHDVDVVVTVVKSGVTRVFYMEGTVTRG